MKAKGLEADADMSKARQALERAAARARQLAEQTGTPLYVLRDGQVVDLNRSSGGSYSLREGRPGK
jgi:dihydroxyacetone kinase-like predicted kinase